MILIIIYIGIVFQMKLIVNNVIDVFFSISQEAAALFWNFRAKKSPKPFIQRLQESGSIRKTARNMNHRGSISRRRMRMTGLEPAREAH